VFFPKGMGHGCVLCAEEMFFWASVGELVVGEKM